MRLGRTLRALKAQNMARANTSTDNSIDSIENSKRTTIRTITRKDDDDDGYIIVEPEWLA